MSSAVDSQKISSEFSVNMYDHDPGATTAIVTSPDGGTTLRTVDMSLWSRFFAMAMVTVPATGALTKLEIIAAAAATMASPEVIKDSGTLVADAVEDRARLECTAEEIAQIARTSGKRLRYAAARLTMSNAGGEAVVTYILGGGRYIGEDKTPDTVIA